MIRFERILCPTDFSRFSFRVDIMLFGSTAQHVVRRAECPVLTISGH